MVGCDIAPEWIFAILPAVLIVGGLLSYWWEDSAWGKRRKRRRRMDAKVREMTGRDWSSGI